MLITISVKDQWALLPIGWFPEEIAVKTELLISASIIYTQTKIEDDLSKTIDYQYVSNEITNLKNVQFKLLETAGEYLINKLHKELHEKVDIQKITVEFKKLNIANSHTNCAFHGIFIEKSFV
jgi:FolB domain-containing protein